MPFPFLELPKELRDLIYLYSLCPRGRLGFKVKWPSKYRGKPDHDQKLALLAVCRQIHDEALPMFYSRNVFYIDRSGYLPSLVRDHNAKFIRAISVVPSLETVSHLAQLTSALGKLSHLEYLELRFADSYLLRTLISYGWDPESLPQKLEDDRLTRAFMSMSGVTSFRIKWLFHCEAPEHDETDPCPKCTQWPVIRQLIEGCLHAEVTQPRAPYGQTPSHLARMAQRTGKKW